ncbi:MAG: hypothetical protein LC685_04375 [Actinobacteria bacterium]|nr:hypothetical protein [Actinomycetota bacterium]
MTTPLNAIYAKTGKPLVVSFGNSVFWPSNGDTAAYQTIAHGLPMPPLWVDIFPALTATGSGWGAETYQSQAADPTNFYVAAFVPSGSFGAEAYYFNWIAISPAS